MKNIGLKNSELLDKTLKTYVEYIKIFQNCKWKSYFRLSDIYLLTKYFR